MNVKTRVVDDIKSQCCRAKIISVIDYSTLMGQLGCEKLRYCDKCRIILEGEGTGALITPPQT